MSKLLTDTTTSTTLNNYTCINKLEKLNNILALFEPISLKEMDNVKLLNRTDTKFVFNLNTLELFLESCSKDYKILTIKNKNIASYKTLYFDTKDFEFYNHHHNQKGNRFKVRIRKYVDSSLCFLEIKNKIKGRTIKTRTLINDFEEQLSSESIDFIQKVVQNKNPLQMKIWNSFDRITLTNEKRKERLTIDINLSFELGEEKKQLKNIVICELKQERVNIQSPAYIKLKKLQIRPARISKYCIGAGSVYENLKINRFKKKFIQLKKISA